MLLTSSLLLHHLLGVLHHLLIVAVELFHLLPLQKGQCLMRLPQFLKELTQLMASISLYSSFEELASHQR